MAKKKYERNASGRYWKVIAVSEWDFDSDGAPKEFDLEHHFLEHEEESYRRRQSGEYPRRYGSLSQEQRALAAVLDANAEENRDVICDAVEEKGAEILRGLSELGDKLEKRFEAEQASDEKYALREFVYSSLKAEGIRQLLEAHGKKTQERRKWSLASEAALICSTAQVREFLAGRSDGDAGESTSRAAPTAASNKKRGRQDGGSIQATLPSVKVQKALGDMQ